MFTRISSLAITLLLTACGPAAEDAAPQAKAATIWCGLGGATELAQDCTLERGTEESRAAFVVRHPDGKCMSVQGLTSRDLINIARLFWSRP
jgi:hypothetical protein